MKSNKSHILAAILLFLSLAVSACIRPSGPQDEPVRGNDPVPEDSIPRGERIKIDDVWTGSYLKFDLATSGNLQAVAYYNSARQIVVAVRFIGSNTWEKRVLLSNASVWDTHRTLTLAFDDRSHLHVSGNMHNSPLVYFRSAGPIISPDDLRNGEFPRINGLGGSAHGAITPEQKVTYPNFIRGPQGEFIFSYRERNLRNVSGGIWVMLKYDHATRSYSRYTPATLFQWNNLYSVYPQFKLNNGVMHVVFQWRDVGGADKNFNVGYVRSTDLVNWKDAFGRAVTLPITPASLGTVVDPVPVGGGLESADLDIARDGSPVLVYHKYEPETGYSQVYAARPSPTQSEEWLIQKLTKNQAGYRWNLPESGGVAPSPPISYSFRQQNIDNGVSIIKVIFGTSSSPDTGDYAIDQGLLTPLLTPLMTNYPAGRNIWLRSNTSVGCDSDAIPSSLPPINTTYEASPNQAKMVTHLWTSSGGLSELQYYLRWETLPSYHDLPRCEGEQTDPCVTEISPPSAELFLYRSQCDLSVPKNDSSGMPIAKVLKPESATLSGDMALTPDYRLAFGNYLSSYTDSSASMATWTFDAAYAGNYGLVGNVLAPTPVSACFYAQVDGGAEVAWHLGESAAQQWSEQPVTQGEGHSQTSFYLTPGTHTVSLIACEPGAQLQYLWIYLQDSRLTYSGPAIATSGFDQASSVDQTAVSGQRVGSSLSSPDITTASATYSISVGKAGKYLILGRTQTQGPGHDQFLVGINGPAMSVWTLPHSMAAWSWGVVPLGVGDGIVTLPAGISTIHISGVSTGAAIDSFYAHYLGP